MYKKILLLTLIFVLFSIYLHSCQKTDNTIVAEVDTEKITQAELNKELNNQYGMEVLQNLINQKLIILEAKKKNISVTEAEIEKEIEKVALNLGGIDKLKEQIKNRGVSMNDYKEKLKLDILLRKLIVADLTEDEIKVFYENNKQKLPIVEVSFIMVPDKNLAESIIKSLKNGGDFSKLAETYSQDPISKDTRGYVGFLARYDISRNSPTFKALEDAIFKNPKPGNVIGPIEIQYNNQPLYYIVKYHNVLRTYEEVKPKIQELLAQQKAQEYIQRLRKNANIKINYKQNLEEKK
ncbi:MAG: SurA N-terminal domain-containing protein [Candidatus Calescibacterium sp.]|nr:SurA N-terminal domain-containing protein [Candidatus Calescibacterium sp.]MCX7972178.1 SurA N-terminal domain-containing protein [bacterium]MDW8194868.1 SurA N-terminal domain-containing protein [Candidatus Calescibacterium sp.]